MRKWSNAVCDFHIQNILCEKSILAPIFTTQAKQSTTTTTATTTRSIKTTTAIVSTTTNAIVATKTTTDLELTTSEPCANCQAATTISTDTTHSPITAQGTTATQETTISEYEKGCSQSAYGISWQAKHGTNATHYCEEFLNGSIGISWWFCDPVQESFLTPRPDRSGCESPWVENVVNMVNDGGVSAFKV